MNAFSSRPGDFADRHQWLTMAVVFALLVAGESLVSFLMEVV